MLSKNKKLSHVTKELREKEMMKSASKLKETSNKSIILSGN